MPSATVATSVWFSSPRRVELREEPLRPPEPGEVLVRTIASGISHGTEMLVYRGQVPEDLTLDLPTLEGSFGFPIKYGYASVGKVESAGADVRGLEEGDLVFVHHPHQTRYVVPAGMAVRLPPGLDPVSGVFLANLETAVNVVLDAVPRIGERVLVFGQGTIGLLLTQLLRRTGVGMVIAAEPYARRRELALTLGADRVLAPGETLVEEVFDLTQGVGADVCIEASGNGDALNYALNCAAFRGTIVVCSWYGTKPVTLGLGGAFHRRRLRLVSSQVSTLDPALEPRWSRPRRLGLALELLPGLNLRAMVTHLVPFDRAADAYELVDHHAEEVVQVVLTYEGPDV